MTKEQLNACLDEWIREQKLQELSAGTLRNYKPIIQRFIDWMPDESEITKETIIDFKAYLGQELGATSTRNHNIVVLDKFLKWLNKQDCCVKTIRVQSKQSNEEIISIADYKRLLRWAKRLGDMQTFYIMKILASTGIRIAELDFFTVENLDFYIDVSNKGKERKIFLRQDLCRELKHYAKEQGIKQGYIFPSPVNPQKMISTVTIWRRMKRVAGSARVSKKKVHAHSFRHLFAQAFLAEHGDMSTLADILGHSSLETTRLYCRTSDVQKRHMLEAMNLSKEI
jgi:site-specific recombinase XerD